MNPPQQREQDPFLGFGETGERLAPKLARELPDAGDHRARLVGQLHLAGTAVARIGAALDPAVFLHAIDLADERHRLDVEKFGKSGLVDAFMAGQAADDLALSARQPDNG